MVLGNILYLFNLYSNLLMWTHPLSTIKIIFKELNANLCTSSKLSS